jgi:hypothetical protein
MATTRKRPSTRTAVDTKADKMAKVDRMIRRMPSGIDQAGKEQIRARCELFISGRIPRPQVRVLNIALLLYMEATKAKKAGLTEVFELFERHAIEIAGAAWREIDRVEAGRSNNG